MSTEPTPEPDADVQQPAPVTKKLTREEKATARKAEKEQEEKQRWLYYASIPAKHWRTMSGRQAKVINEQAIRYGIPFDGAAINLAKVVRGIHNFLADNAHILSRKEADVERLAEDEAIEREDRRLRLRQRKMDFDKARGKLIDSEVATAEVARLAHGLRQFGETLAKEEGGEERRRQLVELLEEWGQVAVAKLDAAQESEALVSEGANDGGDDFNPEE